MDLQRESFDSDFYNSSDWIWLRLRLRLDEYVITPRVCRRWVSKIFVWEVLGWGWRGGGFEGDASSLANQ